jgi:hypothetical protein
MDIPVQDANIGAMMNYRFPPLLMFSRESKREYVFFRSLAWKVDSNIPSIKYLNNKSLEDYKVFPLSILVFQVVEQKCYDSYG